MASHDRDLGLDALTALLAAAFLVSTTPLALGGEDLSALSYPLCAAAGLAFAVRRRAPLATVALVVAAVAAFTLVNDRGGPIFGAAFLALASLAALRPRTGDWLPWAAGSALVLAAASLAAIGPSIHMLPVALLLLAVPKIAADRARTRALREDAREQEAARRLVEERLRIAREVHDVVGHGLATIALRAGVADHVMGRDPHEAQAALRAIRQIARDSLSEVSALLGVLRAEAERAPVPDLEQVPRLVDGLRDAGMAVDLEVGGEGDGVPEVVGAAGYRIVQEALTNVARHAGDGAHARVRLVRRRDGVELEVVDDGRGAPVIVRDGSGLTGMRERAAALGGTFEAGAAPGGGFRVHASLPAAVR
jgi:signal transduction histidine kinase